MKAGTRVRVSFEHAAAHDITASRWAGRGGVVQRRSLANPHRWFVLLDSIAGRDQFEVDIPESCLEVIVE